MIDPGSGIVQHHILADPAIYADPAGNMIVQSDVSNEGDVWNGATFTRNLASVSITTGLVVSVGPQVVGAAAVPPSGQILAVVPAGTQVGATWFTPAQLAKFAVSKTVQAAV